MTIVCGLDQSPKGTGFCYGDGSGKPAFGYQQFSDFGDAEGLLVGHVHAWAKTFLRSIGAEAVFTEQILVFPKRLHLPSLMKQCAVVNAIGLAAHELGVHHYQADVSVWRSRFLGTTRGSTETLKDMALKMCALRGWLIDNHHVAEACGIWDYGLCELSPKYRHRSGPDRRRAELRTEMGAA